MSGYFIVIALLLAYCSDGPGSSTPAGQTSTPASGTSATATPSGATSAATSGSAEVKSKTPTTEPTAPLPSTGILAQLAALEVKGRAPKTNYARSEFGSAWADVDHNGCDTRNDILARDLTDVIYRSGTGDCVVESGMFHDPYTGDNFQFVKSSSGSTIEIDHIVSLSDAWQKGAQQWNADTRKQFANDPLNLISTSRSVNRSKSDGDAATWLPPNKAIRCAFIARQVTVKSAYQLWVTEAELIAMRNILSNCPGQEVANSGTLREK